MQTKILLIYTGGTIGMVNDPETDSLVPLDFQQITNQLPELKNFDCQLDSFEFETPIDSSNVNPEFWVELVSVIESKYYNYDGFVILHGTDTMAHTASALSFMIQDIDKPIILTGSQLPIGTIRTDGKENLITAIEIAMDKSRGTSIVKEVCICFENQLLRGNRSSKMNAEYFNAFSSENYPTLAEIGINIHYKYNFLHKPQIEDKPTFKKNLNRNVAVLKVFPGMTKEYVEAIVNIKNLKGLIIETYGAGNAPAEDCFLDNIELAIEKGIFVINVTQCKAGSVNQGKYETSVKLQKLGVVSAKDMTLEASLTKLMFLLGENLKGSDLHDAFVKSISGEMTRTFMRNEYFTMNEQSE
jgi:L-asparaginase